jgi:hypothetical protein
VSSADIERLVRTAYRAYRDALSGSAPGWDDLSDQEQKAWKAAVSVAAGLGDVTLADAISAASLAVQWEGQTQIFHAEFTAGRKGALAVDDEHASSHHARFQFAHSFWYVEDLGSTNGTYLNGRRILAAQRLKKGDKIRIGRTTMTVVGV